jgi:hypothetical protein
MACPVEASATKRLELAILKQWVTIYKKIDGKWRVIVDMYKSDTPLGTLSHP